MIVLVAKYNGKPGSGDAILASLQKMAPLVKAHEPGCLLYQACRSVDNPDTFLLYEQYRDNAALASHRETPYFQEIIEGTIVPLLEGRQREFYSLVLD
jgi:(4S)-4-hydroxy-5-phosphonooxypentane-2,3-dione isomerase